MKCGILTFIHTLNYGATLQAYALSQCLQMSAYDVEIINYTCPAVKIREEPRLPSFADFKDIKHTVGMLFKFPEHSLRMRRFRNFESKYMSFGNCCHTTNDILKHYNAIIVGSDQVWCPQITGNDLTYILDDKLYPNQRIISYAASFGDKSFPDSLRKQFETALKRFDALSVREERGMEILCSMGIKDAVVSIDPTLLLESDQWKRVEKPVKTHRKYVFAYAVSERNQTFTFAKRAAAQLDADLLYIDAYSGRPVSGARNMGGCGPDEFLWLINNAELVVTSSFHGLCFSILFNKQFRYSLSSKKSSSRLYNLTMQLGLEKFDVNNTDLNNRISYVQPNNELAHLREESMDFLRKALS